MYKNLLIKPPITAINVKVQLPASKSISNRLLILQHLFPSKIEIQNLSKAQDSVLLQKLLTEIANHHDKDAELTLDCENAGTVCRFLTAMLSITKGAFIINGSQRMKERPISPLVDALTSLGASIEYVEKPFHLPISIIGKELNSGLLSLDASLSSQFVTALLMILPSLKHGTYLEFKNSISNSYISMTRKLMEELGITFEIDSNGISCSADRIKPTIFTVEPDWSSAAFWYQIVALSPKSQVYIKGLKSDSLQGDCKLIEVFEALGVDSIFDEGGLLLQHSGKVQNNLLFEMKDFPDIVPSIAVTCAALNITTTIHGIAHLRQKESNRVEALLNEIAKFHNQISATENSICISSTQHKIIKPITFETYNDHRIAMSMAPLTLLFEEVEIQDAEVVAKSYPHFWDDLKAAGFVIQ
ncbi:MAG: 3-phosphoshikimate 1-carboxyvinyltransferase [Bacteroidota bacterium]